MKIVGVITVAITFLVMMTPLFAQAQSSQEARLEARLARVEEGLKALDKRIDDLRDKIKGDINDLRSEIKEDINDLRNLIYVVLAGMFGLVGFVLWDRRSTIAPMAKQTKELEKELAEECDTVRKIFKEHAKREPQFAEVLRTTGIL